MCLEDYRILRASKPYIRRVQITSAIIEVLPANPRRIAICIPAKFDQLVYWSHSNVTQSGVLSPTYITGQDAVVVTGGPYPAIQLSYHKLGNVLQLPLFASNLTGSTFFQIVETLLDYDVLPLDLSQGKPEPIILEESAIRVNE